MAPLRFEQIWNTALLCAVFLVICDRFLKIVAFNFWQEPQEIISGLALMFVKNYNIAFSIPTFINPLIIIIPVTLILIYFLIDSIKKRGLIIAPGLLFILLGAFSNLYDRIVYGYIIDYLYITHFTVFNLADIIIIIGMIFLFINQFRKT